MAVLRELRHCLEVEMGKTFGVWGIIMTSGLTATGILERGGHGNLHQNMQLNCKQL